MVKKATTKKTNRWKRDKIQTVMHEFKHRKLRSGSKQGPVVRSRAQAIAIALSEQRAADGRRRKQRLARNRALKKKSSK
jgi:hypothetical protein